MSKYDQTLEVSSKIGSKRAVARRRERKPFWAKISMKFNCFLHSTRPLVKRRIPAVVLTAVVFLICGLTASPYAGKLRFGQPAKIIAIDPGHGGKDNGAIGPAGAMEKNITLRLARLVGESCSEDYETVLTRRGDYGLGLADRAAAANSAGADLFISIHLAGSFLHQAGGMGVYYYEAQQRSGGGNPSPVTPMPAGPAPWQSLQARHGQKSRRLAALIYHRLSEQAQPSVDKTQGFPLVLLEGADMPAILIEAGYLSNPSEETAFSDSVYLKTVSEAICTGIDDYFNPVDRQRDLAP